MNRRERRKFTAENHLDPRMVNAIRESCRDGIGEIDVMPTVDILAHRQKYEMLNVILYWRRHSRAPKCLFCNFRFPIAVEPPAFFFFARAAHDGPKPWLVSGVCRDCKERPDIADLLSKALQVFFPGVELIDASPGRTQ